MKRKYFRDEFKSAVIHLYYTLLLLKDDVLATRFKDIVGKKEDLKTEGEESRVLNCTRNQKT